jgi:hypothetical protein
MFRSSGKDQFDSGVQRFLQPHPGTSRQRVITIIVSGEQAVQGIRNRPARGEGIEIGDVVVTCEDKQTRTGIQEEGQSTCDSFVTEAIPDGRVEPGGGAGYRHLVSEA